MDKIKEYMKNHARYGKSFTLHMESNNMLTFMELVKLPTPRLLAYFKKHRRYHPDWVEQEDMNQFQQDQSEYLGEIKDLLDDREHVKDK